MHNAVSAYWNLCSVSINHGRCYVTVLGWNMTNIERIKVIAVFIGVSVLGMFFPVVWLLPIWMAAAYGWAQATHRAKILVIMTRIASVFVWAVGLIGLGLWAILLINNLAFSVPIDHALWPNMGMILLLLLGTILVLEFGLLRPIRTHADTLCSHGLFLPVWQQFKTWQARHLCK